MSLRILVEGWTKYPHSYAIVNVYQLVALSKIPNVKLYFREVQPYVKEWPVLGSLVGVLLTEEEQKTIDSIEPYTEGTQVDVIYRISFAHNISPSPIKGVPVVVFYTSEFQKLEPVNFAQDSGFDRFFELMKKGRVAAIAPSQWSKRAFSAKYERKAGNFLKVIPHGVDITKLHPDPAGRKVLRNGLNISPTDVVFLNVGAMTGNKNIIGILQAFYELCQKRDNVRLILKGIKSMYDCEKRVYEYLRALIENGQIKPDIFEKCVGHRITYLDGTMGYSSMRELYNAADCYVCPYQAEGFNMPALEAQACGCPIIMPAGGPTVDFIDPRCALVIPTKETVDGEGRHRLETTPQEIELAMLHVVDNGTELINSAAIVGPAQVERLYTWDRVAEKMVKYFRSLV